VVLAFYAGTGFQSNGNVQGADPVWQEASAPERLLVFTWITGLSRMPVQGDMSIILQVRGLWSERIETREVVTYSLQLGDESEHHLPDVHT
jgi:hypothetical protein